MSPIHLVYASRSRLVEANRSEEVGRMIASAQRLNAQNEVTAFLLVTPGTFAQVLEGEAHNIAETYGRIVVEPHHTGIRVLAEEQIAARSFQKLVDGPRRT